MKRFMRIAIAFFALFVLSGCASTGAPGGLIYTDIRLPLDAEIAGEKGAYAVQGVACATNYLGLISVGDASIDAARHTVNIRDVVTVDYSVDSFLGLYIRYCTIVRGY